MRRSYSRKQKDANQRRSKPSWILFCKPPLKLRYTHLADNDSFWNSNGEINRKFVAKPERHIFDSIRKFVLLRTLLYFMNATSSESKSGSNGDYMLVYWSSFTKKMTRRSSDGMLNGYCRVQRYKNFSTHQVFLPFFTIFLFHAFYPVDSHDCLHTFFTRYAGETVRFEAVSVPPISDKWYFSLPKRLSKKFAIPVNGFGCNWQ